MKKAVLSFLLCVVILIPILGVPVSAASDISGIEASLPEVNVTVNTDSATAGTMTVDSVKADIDGVNLKISEVKASEGTVEWIVLVDTSISSNTYFEQEKNALKTLRKSLGEHDTLMLYTFHTTITKVLDGTESVEEASKKIDGIICDGQDTCFYDSIIQLSYYAKDSDKDICIPIVFSDGVDTESKSDRTAAAKKLKDNGVPLYGFYPDKLDAAKIKSFNAMLAKSGGKAEAFSGKNATKKLTSKAAGRAVDITMYADGDISANENAVLTLDLGNGTVLKKDLTVATKWEDDKEPPVINDFKLDKGDKMITLQFSEEIADYDNLNCYVITSEDEFTPFIIDTQQPEPGLVKLQLNSLDSSGAKIQVVGLHDKANNQLQPQEFELTKVEVEKDYTPYFIIAGAVLLAIIAVIIILNLKKKKKAEAEKKAKYEKKKKIEEARREAERTGRPFVLPELDIPEENAPKKKKKKEKAAAEDSQNSAPVETEEEKKKRLRREEEKQKFQFYFEEKASDDDFSDDDTKSKEKRHRKKNDDEI